MEINMAGSGNVELRGPVKGYKLECNMAGSGNIIAKDIQLDNLSCSLASSGEIEVIGTVDRASFNVAGSGEIKAFDCQARKASVISPAAARSAYMPRKSWMLIS